VGDPCGGARRGEVARPRLLRRGAACAPARAARGAEAVPHLQRHALRIAAAGKRFHIMGGSAAEVDASKATGKQLVREAKA
jgi:hypothetical protein